MFNIIKEKLAKRKASKLSHMRMNKAMLDIPDLSRGRYILPFDHYTEGVKELLKSIEEKYEIDFIGNWWIEGNPYKGLNITLTPISTPKWKNNVAKALFIRGWSKVAFRIGLPIKSELQIHTKASSELAGENHKLYEILRDVNQPTERRQNAFDQMASSFAKVPTPNNVKVIGQPVTSSRPEPSSEEVMANLLEEISSKTEASVELIKPDYPPDLQALLEKARFFSTTQPDLALFYFNKVVEEFNESSELWTQRGVCIALINSGQVLINLNQPDEAITLLRQVIVKAGSDEDLELEAFNAVSLIEKAESIKK